MIFKTNNMKTWLEDEKGYEIAILEHPLLNRKTVDIKQIHVDDHLKGSGIGGRMMKVLAENLQRNGMRAELSCTFAIRWFADHPEYDDIVVNPDNL